MSNELAELKPSTRAQAVDYRTYRRPKDDAATAFESHAEMVERSFVEHHRRLWSKAGGRVNEAELGELRAVGLAGLASVAGRTRWLGGTPYAFERAACMFNCSATEAATVFDVVDVSWLLLNGCGVGFKPRVGTLHGYVQPIGEVEAVGVDANGKDFRGHEENVESLDAGIWTIRVGDSAQAWARAVGKLLRPPTAPVSKLVLDFSQVRGAGGRLKGYGWICNGARPLARAMTAIHSVLNQSAGQLLDEIQILDVVNWLGTILSSRRAAEICELDSHNPRADEFALAKKDYYLCRDCGHWETPGGVCQRCSSTSNNQHRRQSNNTLIYWHRPSRRKIEERLRQADECGGDPGICNGAEAQRRCPWFTLANPCVPAGTRILTDAGYRAIDDLIGQQVNVWNGSVFSAVTPKITGRDQPLVRVTLSSGVSLVCTEYHEWILNVGTYAEVKEARRRAADLQPGDSLMRFDMPVVEGGMPMPHAYTHGFYCGDGFDYHDKKRAWLYDGKKTLARYLDCQVRGDTVGRRLDVRLPEEMPEKFHVPHGADVVSRLAWLSGLLDADGTVIYNPNSVGIQLGSVNRQFLAEIQLLLTTLGVQAKVSHFKDAGDYLMPDGRGGEKVYACQDGYRLLINATDTYHLVCLGLKTNRLHLPALKPQRDARRFVKVVSVESAGIAPEVYCFDEPLAHRGTFEGVVTGQCHEILLPRSGFCNLVTSCLPRFRRNFALLERVVGLMARANYRQTCVNLNDGVLQPTWHQTQESLRLCGVSLTGIVQADWLTDYQIRRLRNAAIYGAYSMADELGLPRPKAVTTLKPEGTISKALGSLDVGEIAEGMGRPVGKYIFNWINFSSHDPIVGLLEAAGYQVIPNPSDSANVLVKFPIDYRGVSFDLVGGKEVNLEPAVEQLARYLRWNTLWADHNVSATICYTQEEIPLMAEWVYQNWDRGFVACAFQRRSDPTKTARDLGHPYLPQEVVARDELMEYRSRLREVEWHKISGWFEIPEEGCASGVCPVR